MTTDATPTPVADAVRAVRTSSRRAQVLSAAARVMQTTGYHQMSMQALADEADISVGLIYTYFSGKQEILLATILQILEKFRDQVEPAVQAAGDDPVARLTAGFRRYTEIIDENLDAVVLTYRESRTLEAAGREQIKQLEVATAAPLRDAVTAGVQAGVLETDDVDLVVFDLVMLAHGWALKHWHFAPRYTLTRYIDAQLATLLRSLEPRHGRVVTPP